MTDPSADDFAALDDATIGELHLPGTPGYAALVTPWNLAVPSSPIAIVAAADAGDVAATVRWARAHEVPVAVRATGHGAVDALDGTLLVHTGRLTELTVSPEGRARIGAGVVWRDVIAAAGEHGFTPLAGSATTVGVVGLVTGGGHGPLARTFGLASDRVTAFDVVTGDGEARRATAEQEPELFWALRGAKGAPGIVTAVELDLLPLPTLYAGALFFDGADTAAVLYAWAEWCPTLPPEATTSIAVLRLPPLPGVPEPIAGRQTIAVRFAWTGDPAAGERVLAPVSTIAPVIFGGAQVMPGAQVGAIHADPTDPMLSVERSVMLRELPPDALDALLAVAGPESACLQTLVEVRQLGGALAAEPEVPSAFCGRDIAFTCSAIGVAAGPNAADTIADAASVVAAMGPWAATRRIPNFDATAVPAELVLTYDADVLGRLADLMDEVDPGAVIAASRPLRAAAVLAGQDA